MVWIGDRRGTVVCDTTVPSRSMCTASSDIVQCGQRVHKLSKSMTQTQSRSLACKILTSLILGSGSPALDDVRYWRCKMRVRPLDNTPAFQPANASCPRIFSLQIRRLSDTVAGTSGGLYVAR